MIGRKAIIGLSLLCALLFSAIAVQSASAAAATNTTAVTCVNVGANKGDFKDAHCDEKVEPNKGEFAHKALGTGLGKTTNITVTNETTGGAKSNQVLKGEPFGVKTTVTCTTVTTPKEKASIGNTEPKGGEHRISGKGTIEYTGCTVTEVAKCTKVKEPILAEIGSVEGLEGLTGPKAEKEAMGLEYKAEAGKPFAQLTLEGTCAIQGKPFPVEGSIIATSGPVAGSVQNNHWSGATQVFEAGNAMSKLTAGGKPATYTGITTTRMEGGNPISTTTCTTTKNCLE